MKLSIDLHPACDGDARRGGADPGPGRARRRGACVAGLVAALAAAAPALAEEAAWPPPITLFDGRFTMAPALRVDLDAGSFAGQDVRPGFQSNVAVRRGEVGLRGQVLPGLDYVVLWDFAPGAPGSQPNGGQLDEAQLRYAVTEGLALRAGVFTPRHTLEASGGSFGELFMEHASIIEMATSLASGGSRTAAGVEMSGESWFASAYATAGGTAPPADRASADSSARGLAGRIAVRPVDGVVQLQFGFNGAIQFRPRADGESAVQLHDYPELRISPNRFLNTGRIPASQAWAVGPELAGMVGPVYLAAEYQAIDVDADSGGMRRFGGWYGALAVPLLGAPRHWEAGRGTWMVPDTPALDPAAGQWGWLELAGRYSRADLNDGPTRGGVQSIWTAGLNWYPERRIRVTMQAEIGQIAGQGPDRPFRAVGWRLSFAH